MDLYGTLVSTRLFVPSDLTTLSSSNLKVSSQRKFVDMGQQPLPIYCLIRHEIPHEDELRKAVKAHKDAEASDMMKRSKWMWFELTPYEFGCDEIGAFIPTWSLGRAFNHGTNIERRPELDLTILSGLVPLDFSFIRILLTPYLYLLLASLLQHFVRHCSASVALPAPPYLQF